MHAATMHNMMHRLCNVVRHYIEYVGSNVYKPVFVIHCTIRKIVKMRKQVSGV